jgi:hypothetical protein
MELDDLKQTWRQSEIKTNTNIKIMDMIHDKNYGPLAILKRRFLKDIRFMAVIPFVLVLTNLDNLGGVLRSVMFWSYVIFCIGVIAFASYNYRIVAGMERMDGMVLSSLEQQIMILEKRLKQHMIGLRIVFVYFIVLSEIMPYFQHYRSLDLWHSISPVIRYSVYASLLVLQYFVSRAVCHRKFGAHISYLKQLIKQMEH